MMFVFIILAAFFNAAMDTLQSHFNTSVFKKLDMYWWNPSYSFTNKYRGNFLRKTVLAFVTDAWHCFKFIALICLSIAFVLYKPIVSIYIDPIIIYTIFGTVFEISYRLLGRKRFI